MSIHSDISKRIGWDPRTVTLPSIDECKALLDKVELEKCESSYEKVFTIHRFYIVIGSETEDQIQAINIIYKAFCAGAKHFS